MKNRTEQQVGWIDWTPRQTKNGTKRERIFEAVLDMIERYRDIPGMLPIGTRQVCYRLKDAGVISAKAEFDNVSKTLVLMRRAGHIGMDVIADGRSYVRDGFDYDDADDVLNHLRYYAKNSIFDLQIGQRTRVDLWLETKGQIPQFLPLAKRYGCSLISASGFDPLKLKHDRIQKYKGWIDSGVCDEVVVLHFGDHDRSGLEIFDKIDEELQEGWGADYPVRIVRGGITPDQIEDMGGDPQEAFELEAFDPLVLTGIVEDAILEHIDLGVLAQAKARQERIRGELMEVLDHAEF